MIFLTGFNISVIIITPRWVETRQCRSPPPVSSNKVAATTLMAAELLFPYLCQQSSAFWEVVVSNTRELPRDSRDRLWISAGGQIARAQLQARSQPSGGELPVAAQDDRSTSMPTVTSSPSWPKDRMTCAQQTNMWREGLEIQETSFLQIFSPTAPFSERPQEVMKTGSPILLHAEWGRTWRAHIYSYGIGLSFFPCKTNVFPLRISMLEVV